MSRFSTSSASILACALIAACSLMCSHASARKVTSPAGLTDAELVTIEFPRKSIGTLQIFDSDGKRFRIPARGPVRLPKNASGVELTIDFASAEDLSSLKRIPSDVIKKLDLSKLEVPDAQFANIAHLTGLSRLNARGTDLKDAGLDCVTGMKNLVDLNIGETLVTSKGLPKLKGLTRLQNLYIDNSNVGDENLDSICHLPELRRVSVSRSHITDKGVKTLASLPMLEMLDVEYTVTITDKCIPDLRRMKKLRQLKIAHSRITSATVKDLKQMKQLEELVYSKNNFNLKDVAELKKSLPKCKIEDYEARRVFQPEIFAPLH